MHSSPCQPNLKMLEASRLRTEMLIIQLSCRSIDYLLQSLRTNDNCFETILNYSLSVLFLDQPCVMLCYVQPPYMYSHPLITTQ